jgi:hypothetical protein
MLVRSWNTADPDAKEGTRLSVLTTKTTNGTKSTVQFVPSAALRYEPENTATAEVLVDEIDAALALEPNEAYDYAVGFIIPGESYDPSGDGDDGNPQSSADRRLLRLDYTLLVRYTQREGRA